MRILFKALVCSVIISIVLSMTGFMGACEEIRSDVFRLHIIANSDSEADQALKLMVRDRIISYTGELFRNCSDKSSSVRCAEEHLGDIRRLAEDVIRENGCSYDAEAYVTGMDFSTRVYDDVTLPAGKYDALRIVIGKGEGHNWWCVLFPALCLPGAKSDTLSDVMNDGEMDIVSGGDKYEVRFKVVEWLEGLFSALHW